MNQKLHAFMSDAITNHLHPIYKYARQSPILQYYAVNVAMLETLTPEQWEKENPEAVTKMTEVMRLCEEDAAAELQKDKRLEDLEKELADLKAKLAAPPAAPEAPAPDTASVPAETPDKPAEA